MSVAEKIVSEIIQPEKKEIVQPQKMGLLVENPVYKPFRYPWCYDAWLTQQRIHWLPEEVPLEAPLLVTSEFFVVLTMHHNTMDI